MDWLVVVLHYMVVWAREGESGLVNWLYSTELHWIALDCIVLLCCVVLCVVLRVRVIVGDGECEIQFEDG